MYWGTCSKHPFHPSMIISNVLLAAAEMTPLQGTHALVGSSCSPCSPLKKDPRVFFSNKSAASAASPDYVIQLSWSSRLEMLIVGRSGGPKNMEILGLPKMRKSYKDIVTFESCLPFAIV